MQHSIRQISVLHLSLVHNIDADTDIDADAGAGIEINPIPASASASTSKDAACVKPVSLMLTLI